MDGIKVLRSTQIIILGICFVVATITSTVILSKGILQMKKFSEQVIKVTGSAEKNIISDAIVWRLNFSRREVKMVVAFDLLKEDLEIVKKYLFDKGVKESEIIVAPVTTTVLYKKNDKGNDTNVIEAYILAQEVEVRSSDVLRIAEISRQATELIENGLEIISQSPEYFYTKLPELKLEMLSEASENAKKRAESMAKASGNKIGRIRSARMGVFQITPVNSFDVSDWGLNDTTSYEKKVNAVVNVEFAISD
ncbi:MAG: SIMPL domain-containing protein [Candidatus Omnitrophica bacterium]|nr:SIMPL domain-containing protein [Candidatus Omnitrophota bacterium]